MAKLINWIKNNFFTIAMVALIILIGGGIYKLAHYGAAESNDPFFIASTDHVKGKENAKITILEYSDFECPFCANYQTVLNQVLAAYPDDVRLVYRHMPLTSIHSFALPAAKATEAANMQGRFWEMHDLLFTNQNTWKGDIDPVKVFESYTELVGINKDQFLRDLKSPIIERKINTDRRFAAQIGVNSTPSFFLNGEKFEAPTDFEAFKKLIDTKLQSINSDAAADSTKDATTTTDAPDAPKIEKTESADGAAAATNTETKTTEPATSESQPAAE